MFIRNGFFFNGLIEPAFSAPYTLGADMADFKGLKIRFVREQNKSRPEVLRDGSCKLTIKKSFKS